MKKIAVFTVLIAMVVSFSTAALAENTIENIFDVHEKVEKPWKGRLTGSWVVPSKSEFKNGWNIQSFGSYDIWKFLAVGMEGGYTQFDAKDSGVDLGTFRNMNMMGDIILKAPLDYKDITFVPYVTNGFGILIPDFKNSNDAKDRGIYVDAKTGFLYKLGGGLDVYITDHIALTVECSYQWTQSKMSVNGGGFNDSGNERLDALFVGGGVTIRI